MISGINIIKLICSKILVPEILVYSFHNVRKTDGLYNLFRKNPKIKSVC